MGKKSNRDSGKRDESYDVKGEKEKLRKMGLEDKSKEGFDRLIQFHEEYQKEEEERKKKRKDERKPFLL